MKKVILLCGILFLSLSCLQPTFAATKTYQVTGPVVEINDKMIVVQKGDEKWEIAREEATKLLGMVKVGDKVTVYYRMTATKIESKLGNGELPSSEKAKKKQAK